jgi:prepilin-type N-terminal cleavage/methylation domain-containing protein
MKRGVTLIELVVSMAIFLVVSTLAIGAFVTATRMRSMTGNMRESQQKMRVSYETITRLARQANKVVVSSNKKTLELYFNTKTGPITAARFSFEPGTDGNITIKYYDGCGSLNAALVSCSSWNTPIDMLGGSVYLDPASGATSFTKVAGSLYPTLKLHLEGRIGKLNGSVYFSDKITVDTTVLLEGIR